MKQKNSSANTYFQKKLISYHFGKMKLFAHISKNNKFKKIYLVFNKNDNRSIKLNEKVAKFKYLLFEDQEKRLKEQSIDCEIIDISQIKKIDEINIGLYPTVGENLDYLNLNNLKINFLYRKLDQYSWQYCNKGFFNFKNYIPKIITMFT